MTAATKGSEISIPTQYFLIVSLIKKPGVCEVQVIKSIHEDFSFILFFFSYLFVESMPFFKPECVVNSEWQINNGTECAQDQS